MASIKDDRGYNQGFAEAKSTMVRMGRRTDLLLSEMEITRDTRILEIGCGTGEVSYWMAERSPAQVWGTDFCTPFIEEAKKKYQLPNLRYEVVDFNNPNSFSDMQFDYIVGNGILHHLYNNLDEALASMRCLLKENGKIIFLEPNFYNPYIYFIFSYPRLRAKVNLEPGEMAFSKRFIAGKLAQAGFEDIRVEYRDFLLPGIPNFLIAPSIAVGAVLERIPLVSKMSQSIFIRASKLSSGIQTRDCSSRGSLSTYGGNIWFLIRYGISGVIGGAITVLFLYMWVTRLGLASSYLLGLILGFILALIVTFVLQKYWAFRDFESNRTSGQLLSYSVVALTGLALNAMLLAGARELFSLLKLDFFHGWYLIVQTGIVCIVAVFNFSMNFLFTFRHAKQRQF